MTSAGTTWIYTICSPILWKVSLNLFSVWRNSIEKKNEWKNAMPLKSYAQNYHAITSATLCYISQCNLHSHTRFKRVNEKLNVWKWGAIKWLSKGADTWRNKKFVDWHVSTPIKQNGDLASSTYLFQYNFLCFK